MFKTFKKWSPDTWKQSLVQEIAEKFRVTNTYPEQTACDTNNRIDDIAIQIDVYVKDLIKAVQEPLQTRWWTVGSLLCGETQLCIEKNGTMRETGL
jgi:hypothetical protein